MAVVSTKDDIYSDDMILYWYDDIIAIISDANIDDMHDYVYFIVNVRWITIVFGEIVRQMSRNLKFQSLPGYFLSISDTVFLLNMSLL